MDTETTPEYWWTLPTLFMSSFGGDPIIYPLLIYFVPLINGLILNTSTRLRSVHFFLLSRLVSKVVSDFWEGVLGRCCVPLLEVMVRNHLSSVTPGLASSAVHKVQGQRWKGIIHEEKGKEHNVSFDSNNEEMAFNVLQFSSHISKYRGGRNLITRSLQIHMFFPTIFAGKNTNFD